LAYVITEACIKCKFYAEKWPNITRKKTGFPDADQWKGVPQKLADHFSPDPEA
jgi:hypothetical protein